MSRFLLNAYINSILIFLTTALLVELALLFCPRAYRLRMFARFIPLLKVVIDLFRFPFFDWVSPHLAVPGTRMFGVAFGAPTWWNPWPYLNIGFSVEGGGVFTFADMFISYGGLLICAFLTISLWKVTKLILSWRRSYIWTHSVLGDATEKVVTSSKATVPFATLLKGGKVVLPESLSLSDEERKAVIAHEKAHLFWKDPYFLAAEALIAAVFWCIPGMNWWRKKIALERESACDRKSASPVALAGALQKGLLACSPHLAVGFQGAPVVKRVERLLSPKPKRNALTWVGTFLFTDLSLAVLFGRFWLG